jgi:hypothetical protein
MGARVNYACWKLIWLSSSRCCAGFGGFYEVKADLQAARELAEQLLNIG